MSASPVFVHSMFRAGSTYVFTVFRHAGVYRCFYEPMHELVAWAAEDPERLSLEADADKIERLHHPKLSAPYFQELHDSWPAWRSALDPSVVYGGYFAVEGYAAGASLYQSLIESSEQQVMFGDCRTAGRIGTLKAALGGDHLLLWRNPWDQWWSYQVDRYFDCVNRIIAGVNPRPEVLTQLTIDRNISPIPDGSFAEKYAYCLRHPMGPDDSYALFYALWLLALDEGLTNADVLINIDTLSADQTYRNDMVITLFNRGISGLAFDDAHCPKAQFSRQEQQHFLDIEQQVHDLWVRVGGTQRRLDALLSLRSEHLPTPRQDPSLQVVAERHRRWVLDQLASNADLAAAWAHQLDDQQAALDHQQELHAQARELIAEQQSSINRQAVELERVLELHARADDIIAEQQKGINRQAIELERVLELQAQADEIIAEQKNALERQQGELAELQLHVQWLDAHITELSQVNAALTASLSWRITSPLRSLSAPWFAAYRFFATSDLSTFIKWFANWVQRYPRLMVLLSKTLLRLPKLRRLVANRLARPRQLTLDSPNVIHNSAQRLSPRAEELQAHIAREVEALLHQYSEDVAGDICENGERAEKSPVVEEFP